MTLNASPLFGTGQFVLPYPGPININLPFVVVPHSHSFGSFLTSLSPFVCNRFIAGGVVTFVAAVVWEEGRTWKDVVGRGRILIPGALCKSYLDRSLATREADMAY
jgi:hypothetical protein